MKLPILFVPTALLLTGCASKPAPVPTVPAPVENTTVAETQSADDAIMSKPTASPSKSADNNSPEAPATDTPATDTPATDTPASYRVRAQVVEVLPSANAAAPMLMVKHEAIPGFMPAMQMRLPLANAGDAAKVKPGDKIAFDLKRSNVEISNIEVLPAATELKLEK